jgi:hypothetical protein
MLACLTTAYPAAADEIYTFVIKKQEEKAKTGWNLSDWLATRDKMRLMDLWLALHSPTPYEFFVGGSYWLIGTGSQKNALRVQAAAYASIFGLEYQRGFSSLAESLYFFHLRIFGFHAQGTNITLQTGIRSSDEPSVARSAFAGVGMSIYLARFFGIDGFYRHYFASVPSSAGYAVSGSHAEGGAFIDFKFFRIFGNYFYRPETTVRPGTTSNQSIVGANLGMKLFF